MHQNPEVPKQATTKMTTNSLAGPAVATILALAVGYPAIAARADDFRVENRVYIGGKSTPDSQGVTIFYGGLVYDFLSDPAEVIVFDKAHEQFSMLDIGRRARADLSTGEVRAFVERVRQRLAGHSDPMKRWLSDPVFKEDFDAGTGRLTLTGAWMTYEAQIVTRDASLSAQYREFSDAYAQLNSVLNPGSRPPLARMALNEAILRRQAVAKEVRLTLKPDAGSQQQTVRSQHDVVLKLDADDVRRVAEVRQYLRDFQPVSFEQYRKW